MTAPIGFPLGTIYNITNISQDMPGVVTLEAVTNSVSFSVALGQTVTISKVQGMHEINDQRFVIANLDTNAKTFQLYDLAFHPVDTRGYSPYVAGGQINIISYPATAGNPPGLMYNNQ